jgi:alpha-beta hydrolase superfamily lysophospholipase
MLNLIESSNYYKYKNLLSYFNIELLKKSIPELNLKEHYKYNKVIIDYFNYYNLNITNVKHHFGYIKANNLKIINHVFEPVASKGIIFLIHGYFDHSGYLSNLISFLTKQNFIVISIDLPGHGLSDGERYSIDDFTNYAYCLYEIINYYKSSYTIPFYIIGHSAGCSVIYEYINNYNYNFEKIIFAAPLIRSYAWHLSKAGYILSHKFFTKLPRATRNDTSNKEFIKFRKHLDPLKESCFPLKWVNALYNWNKKINNYNKLNNSLTIIQGENDKTVSWKYNIEFLMGKFSDIKINLIKDAGHQLLNENKDKLDEVLKTIQSSITKESER